MRRARLVFSLFAAAIAANIASAQSDVVHVPESKVAPFAINRYAVDLNGNPFNEPATFDLIPKSPNGPQGKIWVRSDKDGLVIWGRIAADEKSLRWPKQKADMLASNHVEVWLATSTEIPMPAIGYGNQFGPEEFKSAADCKGGQNPPPDNDREAQDCVEWYNQQVQYRALLKRLFARQWLVAEDPRHSFEDFATSAYSTMKSEFFDEYLPKELEPKANDGFRSEIMNTVRPVTAHDSAGNPYQAGVITGYEFHISIPYSAFPPSPELTLRDLWLMVDVFNAADPGRKMGAYSTTSAHREWGAPTTFNHIQLDAPHSAVISPCNYKLEESDVYGNTYPAWYFPVASSEQPTMLTSDFALINSAGGYEYTPSTLSPVIETFPRFTKHFAGGITICGPNLAYQSGNIHRQSDFEIDEKNLEARRMPDGWLLLRSGPTMTIQNPKFGSGQCGACEVETLQMYAISPSGEITQSLDLGERLAGNQGDADALDYAFSSEWDRITYYTEYPEDESENPKTHANSVTYCLKDHRYEKCEEAGNVKMPNPPHFKEPENPQ